MKNFKEEKPPIGTYVLVYSKSYFGDEAWHPAQYLGSKAWNWYMDGASFWQHEIEVTHWMEMPERP